MFGMNRGVTLGLWAVTLIAAFAFGRAVVLQREDTAPEDMGAAVRAALAEVDVQQRLWRLTSALQHLDPENVSEVSAVYEQIHSALDACDIRPFVHAWARFDPAAALDHVRSWRLRMNRRLGTAAAIEAWAGIDPLAAQLAFEQLISEHADLRDALFEELIVGWTTSGQPGLEVYMLELETFTRDTAVGLAVVTLGRNGGVDAIIGWGESVLANSAFDDQFKRMVFRRVTRVVARWDAALAVAWVHERAHLPYTEDGPRIVTEQWAELDGRAAMEWALGLPAGAPRDDGVRSAFITWRKSDPGGAVDWLDAASLTEAHDPVVYVYAVRLGRSAPVEAIHWCERLHAAKLRLGCLGKAAGEWYQRDPVAAESWLQTSPLDEEARRKARTPPKKRRKATRQGGAPRGAGPKSR